MAAGKSADPARGIPAQVAEALQILRAESDVAELYRRAVVQFAARSCAGEALAAALAPQVLQPSSPVAVAQPLVEQLALAQIARWLE